MALKRKVCAARGGREEAGRGGRCQGGVGVTRKLSGHHRSSPKIHRTLMMTILALLFDHRLHLSTPTLASVAI